VARRASQVGGALMLGKIRRLCDRRLRALVYWLVLFLLPLEILASIEDHRGYLEDPRTYNQVYHNLQMQQLVSHVTGVLAAMALVYQLQGWRGRRFSPFTIGYFVLTIGFGIVADIYDLNPICCT
jgi:hypothetical protein